MWLDEADLSNATNVLQSYRAQARLSATVVRAVVKCTCCGKVHEDRAKWANFNRSKHVCMYVLWFHLQVATTVHWSRQPVSEPTDHQSPRLELIVACSLLLVHMVCSAARVGDLA